MKSPKTLFEHEITSINFLFKITIMCSQHLCGEIISSDTNYPGIHKALL
jgi:hypothetical protein